MNFSKRRRRNIYQRMKPITIKNTVLSLGSGKIVNNYEYEITGTGELQQLNLNQIISANQDASQFFANYVYCKLLGITLTIIPSNISGEVLANIRWNGSIQGINNLKQDNSTRRVPTNIRNYKNIYIKIPDIIVETTGGYPIQLNKLITTKQAAESDGVASYKLPGIIYLLAPEGVVIRATLKIGFRQNDTSVNTFQKAIKAELLKGRKIFDLIKDIDDFSRDLDQKKKKDPDKFE